MDPKVFGYIVVGLIVFIVFGLVFVNYINRPSKNTKHGKYGYSIPLTSVSSEKNGVNPEMLRTSSGYKLYSLPPGVKSGKW